MAYDNYETSALLGAPIELYEFIYSGAIWRYTSYDTEIKYNNNLFTPMSAQRGELQPTTDPTEASLSITLPNNSEIGDLYRIQPPSEIVTCSVYRGHSGDNEFKIIWKGRIIAADWHEDVVELTSENVFSSIQNPGLPRTYCKTCPHQLYGPHCKAKQDSFKVEGIVNEVDGLRVRLDSIIGLPENAFYGGFATWVNSKTRVTERRAVLSSISATGWVRLAAYPLGLVPGIMLKLYYGCDHTLESCDQRFNNTDNFGGFPYLPTGKGLFNGEIIY